MWANKPEMAKKWSDEEKSESDRDVHEDWDGGDNLVNPIDHAEISSGHKPHKGLEILQISESRLRQIIKEEYKVKITRIQLRQIIKEVLATEALTSKGYAGGVAFSRTSSSKVSGDPSRIGPRASQDYTKAAVAISSMYPALWTRFQQGDGSSGDSAKSSSLSGPQLVEKIDEISRYLPALKEKIEEEGDSLDWYWGGPSKPNEKPEEDNK